MRRTQLPIDAIQVGERAREELGDIDSLATSIQEHGLLHPVIVDSDYRLIAGERRLSAARLIGMTVIDVSISDATSDVERLDVELAENVDRKDFEAIEHSRALVRRAQLAAHVISTERGITLPPEESRTTTFGPISKDVVADRIGTSRATVLRAVQHVQAVDRYPELEHADQGPALVAARSLDTASPQTRYGVREALRERKITVAEVPIFVVAGERREHPSPATVAAVLAGGIPDSPDLEPVRWRQRFIQALTAFESQVALLPAEDALSILHAEDFARCAQVLANFQTWQAKIRPASRKTLKAVT